MDQKVAQAEAESGDPDLWLDPKKAEQTLKNLKYWQKLKEVWDEIRHKRKDLEELDQMIDHENADEMKDYGRECAELDRRFQKAHLSLFLNGPYDRNDAIVVISSGVGGVEAQDWAEMLLRMYLRYAEEKGWKTQITEKHAAEEAGIKSATLEVRGELAYGYLKSEHGVHRLVRLSPFNAKNLRQTSFALVEVLPILPENEGIEINPNDLRVDTYRASGAGGQHVNKTDSAVRITHLPTGLVVTCQSERSQGQNRLQAMGVLKSRLLQRSIEEQQAKMSKIKGEHKEAGFGNQIRSYTFQPYQLVKDHRTGAETNQVEKVMDGWIDPFVESYLLSSPHTL